MTLGGKSLSKLKKMNKHQYQFPIESDRLVYSHLHETDQEEWEAFFIDNPQLNFVGITQARSAKEESRIWLNRQIKRYEETGIGILGARIKEDQRLIGNAGIIWREDVQGRSLYEIGYSVIPELWGKGFASEMAKCFRKYFVKHSIDKRVHSLIHIDNIGSQKVAEKNKMKRISEFEFLNSPCYLYEYQVEI